MAETPWTLWKHVFCANKVNEVSDMVRQDVLPVFEIFGCHRLWPSQSRSADFLGQGISMVRPYNERFGYCTCVALGLMNRYSLTVMNLVSSA